MRTLALSQRAAPADRERAVSTSSGLLLIVLATALVCVAGIVVVGRARREARASDGEALASRGDTQRMLAENWALVEKTARETGMSEEEIAHVRANVLGLGDG
jgi:uncharacterized protein HemX